MAALRQITAAIEHFHKQEFECSITLAAAAEGLLPPADAPHSFKEIKEHLSEKEFKEIDVNLVVNWLKHASPPDASSISEFDAVIVLLRAITKFIAVYRKSSGRLEDFNAWARNNGYPAPGTTARSWPGVFVKYTIAF